ncbi:hypothetical protein AK88_04812 [Plasmodium fragile]|uniref:Cysteine-rich protective antigen 6 bladed domain-containing protein n=1 Tax=Plasmodium fragile TaxID=5857 RepID=A0A0D9QII9_PLAFR|nr:uncharacterized protein AK88_04812 [Plasmodium fragile]KJP85546.1 hypothetical protein AK88_04812 [Plasmodium fragile]
MIINKFALLFFCVLRCLSTNEESKQIIILNDEITTIKSPIHCISDIYFVFRNELYKTCVQHVTQGKTEIHVLVQKQVNSTWETQQKLLEHKRWFQLPAVFSFVQDNEIIIIVCKYKGITSREGTTCERWNSSTGTNYTKELVNIEQETFEKQNLDSYAADPLTVKDKKMLHICGMRSYEFQNEDKDSFISCVASEDKGKTWRTKIIILYEQFKKRVAYFYLRPLVFADEFGFYCYSRVSTNDTDRGGKYMKCTQEATYEKNKEYKFRCEDVNLIKQDKSLQNVTKLNGYYITSYAKKNNFNECYLYYTESNAIVVKPTVHNVDLNGCYGGSFVKVNEGKVLFIYSTGYGIQNIHTLNYTRYD